MDIITDAVDALIDDVNRDDILKQWFEAVDFYIRKVRSFVVALFQLVLINHLFQVLKPGYVLEPNCANQLRDLGKEFYDTKYRDHFDNLFNSVGNWFKAMGDDPVSSHPFCP